MVNLKLSEERKYISINLQKVIVENLRSSVHIRYLDENSFDRAIQSPEDFRTQILEKKFTVNGSLKFELLPFGLVCIDSYDE